MNILTALPPTVCMSLFCIGPALAFNAVDPISGLPMPPEFRKMDNSVVSYRYCGKAAQSVTYLATGLDGMDAERAWYSKSMPGAKVFTAFGGVVTYITADGTAAVELADTFVSYFKFSPGLTPAEMKILGAAPAARACTPD